MNTLGATLNLDLKKRTLDWGIKSGEVKLQDCFYPIHAVTNTNEGGELAWSYYKENFELIKEKLAKASSSLMDAMIVYSTTRFCTASKADEIAEFFKVNPL